MGLKFLYEQQYKFKKVILFAMMQNYSQQGVLFLVIPLRRWMTAGQN